ncbi:MAG: hypothetical protein ACXVZ3_09020 [Gaiellaceae bacterium]
MKTHRTYWWLVGAVLLVAAALLAPAAGARSLAAPVNTCAPTLSGQTAAGRTLTSSTGCWGNHPTAYAYQWLRCDVNGGNCVTIASATFNKYTLTSTDAGHTLISLVTASNADGKTGPINSKPSAVVSAAAAPQNTTPPSITGKAVVGELLFADPGKYTAGIPNTYAYQWVRCNSGGGTCSTISGERNQTYRVRSAVVGYTLRVAVKASNAYGSTTTTSDRTAVVTAVPVVVVTTSMTASTSVVTCCATSVLTGTVSTNKAGEVITILALPYGELAATPLGTATTTGTGQWTFTVRPAIQTTYTAKTSTSTGAPITISVHPRVGLGYQGGIFSTKVTGGAGATSFAGKVVLFQRRNASGHWVTLDKVVLNLSSAAKFKVKLPKGASYVRVYMTQTQAGGGYLNGTSTIRRFTR